MVVAGALAPCLGRIALVSEVADSLSQLDVIHPYLPTHWWLSFDSLSARTHVIAAIEESAVSGTLVV
jgi:hypothetical protein